MTTLTIPLPASSKRVLATKKHNALVQIVQGAGPISMNTASYWSGGSRSSFTVVDLATGKETTPRAGAWPNYEGANYPLRPGEAFLERGTFCGKEAMPHLTFFECDREAVKQLFHLPL